MSRRMPLTFTLLLLALPLAAEERSPLGEALNDLEPADHWIYNDFARARDEARATGKPLLVVLRCVPCPPGKTLDEQVARPDATLEALEKQFVCVRLITATGLDLEQFEFDFDMSYAAVFLNADGTVYGRYGTRYSSGHHSDGNLSDVAFANTARRVLGLHRNFSAVRPALAAKAARPGEWKRPEDIPGLTDRRGAVVERKNCIHCHMVKDYGLRAKWLEGRLAATDLFVYPAPQSLGMELDRDDGLRLARVEAGSPAAKAGLRAGDELTTADGQPLTSTADLTWALHVASPEATTVALAARRGGETISAKLELADGWKHADLAWRGSTWYGLRQGLKVDPVPLADRAGRGLPTDGGALEIKGLFGKLAPGVFEKAGLRKGDVIVAVDGKPAAAGESDFLVDLRLNRGPGDSVRFTFVRDGKPREATVPLW